MNVAVKICFIQECHEISVTRSHLPDFYSSQKMHDAKTLYCLLSCPFLLRYPVFLLVDPMPVNESIHALFNLP